MLTIIYVQLGVITDDPGLSVVPATLGGEPTVTLARYLKRTTVDLLETYRSRWDVPTTRPTADDQSQQSNS